MLTIPKIDLSKYNTSDRLNSNVEVILVNGIIAFNGDLKKTAKHFNIDISLVNITYVKYYSNILKIIDINKRNDKTQSTIDNIVSLYYGHVDEIKRSVDANTQTKILSEKLINNLNRICDRAIELKENANKQFEVTVNRLNDQIIKFKQLEVIENGKLEDIGDYLENQNSVLEKLSSVGGYDNYASNKKHVEALDLETGKVEVFPTLQSLTAALGLASASHLSTIIKAGQDYKGKFRFKYTEDEPTITDSNYKLIIK